MHDRFMASVRHEVIEHAQVTPGVTMPFMKPMPLMKHAVVRYSLAAAFALVCTGACAQAQAQDGKGTEVKKQTAASSPQTVIETPRSRDEEKEHHVLDATNTKRYPTDHSLPRDGYGVPVPQPPAGQGTNSSTDAMRAADRKH